MLVENRPGHGCGAAHGFAAWLEVGDDVVLVDTGPDPDLLARNAAGLGLDLARVDAVVLSHGHLDHSGGLPAVAGARDRRPLTVVLHPDATRARYSRRTGTVRPIGMPQASRSALQAAGVTVVASLQPTAIAPGVWATGAIPRDRAATGEAHLTLDPEGPAGGSTARAVSRPASNTTGRSSHRTGLVPARRSGVPARHPPRRGEPGAGRLVPAGEHGGAGLPGHRRESEEQQQEDAHMGRTPGAGFRSFDGCGSGVGKIGKSWILQCRSCWRIRASSLDADRTGDHLVDVRIIDREVGMDPGHFAHRVAHPSPCGVFRFNGLVFGEAEAVINVKVDEARENRTMTARSQCIPNHLRC